MDRHGARKTKGNRTLLTQILFVVLTFVFMVTLSRLFLNTIVRGGLVRSSKSVLDFAEDRILADLAGAQSALEGFSKETGAMILRGDTAEDLREYIGGLLNFSSLAGKAGINSGNFYGYFRIGSGEPVLISGESRFFPDAANPEESEWYQAAAAANGAIIETTPFTADDGQNVFTYAQCIVGDAGEQLGVACLDVRMQAVGNEVVHTALNQGGYGMLLTRDLLILSHPNPDFVGLYASDPAVPLSAGIARALQSGLEVSEYPLTSYKGERAVAFFRTLPNGWHLGLVTPESQYYSSMDSMTAVLFALGTVLAALLIGILIRIDRARVKSDNENKQKSIFLANMSHEIRTPINAIVGMTAVGRAAGTPDRKDYCFSKIDSASRHLLGVVNDILDISKIEANKIELSPTNFSFEKMLQQTVSVSVFQADEKRQKLTVHIDPAIPKFLFADDQRIAQVITNLLGNAVKFTPDEGSISLRTVFLGEKDGLCSIKLEVTDSGIGISPEQQQRLFQSFQQGESSTTRKYGGTGLGLAISKSIVEMMGGKIWVTSELGQGTSIAFTLKVKRGESCRFEPSLPGVSWESVRILAVDDDRDILTYFQATVSGLGAACDTAEGADDALRMIGQNGDYNIYFVDLRMPGMDGIGLTKEIRRVSKNPDRSVVIMISSADLSAVEQEAKSAGVDKFLLKPLFPSAIVDAISECIGMVNEKTESKTVNLDGIFQGHRILFAEDIDINREIVIALLEPTLLEIECAESGVEAVRMFAESPEKYDMIFMDIQMPEMDGYEATRQIRSLPCPRGETIPIVAMTANVFKEDIENCIAAGMNGHLGKPIEMDEMIRELQRYLLAGAPPGGTAKNPG